MKTESGLLIPNKKLVYTSIFGDYDELQDPQVVPDDVDFYCCGKHGESWKFDKKTCIKFGSRAVS